MKRAVNIIVILLGSFALVALLVPTVRAQSPTSPTAQVTFDGEEFTLPISHATQEDWPVFVGVGHTLRYPPGWDARLHQTQGGVRNGATYQFVRTDGLEAIAQIEMLEIVDPITGAAVMETELAYWEQQGESHGYLMETVGIQKQRGWWIHTTKPLKAMGLAGTLWVDWGERVYRFRLHCQPDKCAESERQLRQMLSTLQVTVVEWQRAPGAPPTSRNKNAPGEAMVAPSSSQVVTYNRNAAYAYASTYWNQKTNDDGYYLTSGGYDADGAHFVNRAVHAGRRPIPGLWNAAAINVAALRDWLQGDGWTITPAAQAMVGDVAIMGPFDNPCWSGLVVVTGANPTLATHSDELWTLASTMYCYDNGSPTYVKTYLHANTEIITPHVYLPVVMRDWPPMKKKSGIHLGNRQTDWLPAGGAPLDFLHRLDGYRGGIYPAAIVVLSDQLYFIDRHPSAPCNIAQARVRTTEAYKYLTQATKRGTKVIIRISPSPGNFTDYANPGPNHTLLAGTVPAGNNYCGENPKLFRAIDDIATEMNEIYKVNVDQNKWDPSSFFFVPANEPNKEWYADWPNAVPKEDNSAAWQAMEAYFSALYDHAHSLNPRLQILTPPMSQNLYAEARAFGTCELRQVIGGGSGYDWMRQTYTTKNDGYSWHNYWRKAQENWQENFCADPTNPPTSDHVFQYFPDWLRTEIRDSSKPAFIIEADLLSPCVFPHHSITDKDTQAEAAQESIWHFISEERRANYVITWLLTNEFSDASTGCAPNDEIAWHEAYRENGERDWFRLWWRREE